jgi:hypothetical protein
MPRAVDTCNTIDTLFHCNRIGFVNEWWGTSAGADRIDMAELHDHLRAR